MSNQATFRQRDSGDVFGSQELVLLNNDGSESAISIVDQREDGDSFIVYLHDDEWQRADTIEDAKQIALHLAGVG